MTERERSRWRVSIAHPLRSVYVEDSHAVEPFEAAAEVAHRFQKRNPSLKLRDCSRIDARRVHEGDEAGADIEGAPA